MTKQKFYEKIILKSYEYSGGTALEHEADKLQSIMEWPPTSFEELMLKRSVCGFKLDIPVKQPFDKLGFEYFAQITGFVQRSKDYEFIIDYFDFLEKIKNDKKIIDISDDDHVDILYTAYYDSITGEHANRDFAERMADFILLNCENSRYYKNVISLSYAFGLVHKVDYFKLVKMKHEHELKEIA